MIEPKRLREYLIEAKAEIEEINKIALVIDDSQIVEKLRAFKDSDNLLLMGVIPEYDSTKSNNMDNVVWQNHLAFLILEKVNYKSISDDEETEVWQRTLEAMQKFVNFVFNSSRSSEICPEFRRLNEKSLNIDPVWKLAACNGYILTFSFS